MDKQPTRALTCVVRDITDRVGIICRWLETTRKYFTSGNNTDGQSRAYGYTAALSPQTSMMTSAGDFDTGRCAIWEQCGLFRCGGNGHSMPLCPLGSRTVSCFALPRFVRERGLFSAWCSTRNPWSHISELQASVSHTLNVETGGWHCRHCCVCWLASCVVFPASSRLAITIFNSFSLARYNTYVCTKLRSCVCGMPTGHGEIEILVFSAKGGCVQ